MVAVESTVRALAVCAVVWLAPGVGAVRVAPSSRQLTTTLKRSPSMASLLEHHSQFGETFNHIHVCAFWARAGRVGGPWVASVGVETASASLRPILSQTAAIVSGDQVGA
jgi:hypothetical protein